MYKTRFVLYLLLASALLLCACSPSVKPMPDAALTSFAFSEQHSSRNQVTGYRFDAAGDVCTVSFFVANEESPRTVTPEDAWVSELSALIARHQLMAWDGFDKSASALSDGTQFSLAFGFADGTRVNASGHGAFPEGYRDAAGDIDAHFMLLWAKD